MGKQRKTWASGVKEEIVLAVLSGEKSIAELARQHGVAESLIHNWRTQFVEAGRARLAGNRQDDGFKALEKENERLKSLLGEGSVRLSFRGTGGGQAA